MRRLAPFVIASAIALSFSVSAFATDVPAVRGLKNAIAISYTQVPLSENNPREQRVGRLIYRGGLELASPDPRFGGWSGLIVSRDGKRMLSQSDAAHWLRARLRYDAGGNLAGIAHAQLNDMRGLKGQILTKSNGDAEGLDALTPKGPDGPVLVSFEGRARIWRYNLTPALEGMPKPVAVPVAISSIRGNQGLEGLTIIKPGTLFTVTETVRGTHNNMKAWLVSYKKSHAGVVRYQSLDVKAHAPYQISDAAMGPSRKHLYLLERHYFGLIGGVVIAVREIDAADVKDGVRLDGHEIAKFTMRETIDNMEGLALRRGADGKTYLYMISDDNYNRALQRTLLLMFELVPAQYPPKPDSGGTMLRKSQ